MATPKLLQALSSISDDEWNSFRKYLLISIKKDSISYKCFKRLYDHRTKMNLPDYDEHINKKYFPSIKPKAFSNTLSRIFVKLEEWLALESFRNERHAKELQLIKAYNLRGLFKLADQTAAKLENKIKSENYLSLDRNKSLTQLYHSQYYSNNPIKRKEDPTLFADCLTNFIRTTNEYAVGYLLELENQAQTRNIQNVPLKEALSKLRATAYTSELNEILGHTYKMFCNNDKAAYLRLENILQSEVLDSASDLFLILTIYLRRVSGELYQKQLISRKQALTAYQLSFLATAKNNNQKFSAMNLFNGVTTLGTMLSYKETEAFISKWIDKVHTKHKESTAKFCQVLNYFRHDNYQPIPQLLQGLMFDQYIYKIISQVLLIIAHYKQLGEEELVSNLIQNLRNQMKRNASIIPKQNYSKIQNLLRIIELLIKSKYDRSININLEDYDAVYYRSWVNKQLKT